MKRIAITGTLSKPRKEYINEIELLGHKFDKTVVKATNVLVVGKNKDVLTNKAKKAQDNGTVLGDEKELQNFIKQEQENI